MAQYQDLLKDTSKPWPDNKDYFELTITDLNPGTTYPLQFRWVFADNRANEEWSAVKNITTPAETINTPQFESTDLTVDGFNMIVNWSGNDSDGNPYQANLDRVDIYIRGGKYGATSVYSGRSFKQAGKEIFSVNTSDTYYVKLKAISKRGGQSAFSTERAVTTVAPLVVDLQGPGNVTTVGTPSAGVDSSGAIGFNGYIDLSWTAVVDTTLRGYRIRFRTGTTSYSYADSPGTGTTYRLRGLAVGATYEIGIATYDELNNTSSSYTSFTSTAIGGTPFVGTNVNTTGYFSAGTSPNDFQFGYGIDSSNNSNTFAGTKRGLYFTSSNYWVIDSLQTAKFKLGGASNNYVQWQDNVLTVDGNIVAKGGSFSGNVLMSSTNASIYNIDSNHTMNVDGTLPSGSTGFVLNATGLQFKISGSDKINLNASNGSVVINGAMTATDATITGTFRTAASTSYPRIEMTSSSNKDYVFFYDGSGAYGAINTGAGGTNGAMYLTAPGATLGTTAAVSQIAIYSSSNTNNANVTRLLDGSNTYRFDVRPGGFFAQTTSNIDLFAASSSGFLVNYNIDNINNPYVRNISATTTTGYPTGGNIGEIVLVREA